MSPDDLKIKKLRLQKVMLDLTMEKHGKNTYIFNANVPVTFSSQINVSLVRRYTKYVEVLIVFCCDTNLLLL